MREIIQVDKKLYNSIINENIKLRIALAECKKLIEQLTPKPEQPMENQITIEEWQKRLTMEKKQ